jgi:hypothetical protein
MFSRYKLKSIAVEPKSPTPSPRLMATESTRLIPSEKVETSFCCLCGCFSFFQRKETSTPVSPVASLNSEYKQEARQEARQEDKNSSNTLINPWVYKAPTKEKETSCCDMFKKSPEFKFKEQQFFSKVSVSW